MKNIVVGIALAAAKQAAALEQKALRSYSWPLVAALAMTVTVSTTVPAQAQKAVSRGDTISKTFVIDAIDHTSRVVTLRDDKGESETIVCGPDVQRFDALKVGNKVTFRYHESVVYQIRKPGSTPPAQE